MSTTISTEIEEVDRSNLDLYENIYPGHKDYNMKILINDIILFNKYNWFISLWNKPSNIQQNKCILQFYLRYINELNEKKAEVIIALQIGKYLEENLINNILNVNLQENHIFISFIRILHSYDIWN